MLAVTKWGRLEELLSQSVYHNDRGNLVPTCIEMGIGTTKKTQPRRGNRVRDPR